MDVLVRSLTIACLAGLLLSVGLRLQVHQVVHALRRCRLLLVLSINFAAVPALVLVLARLFELSAPVTTAMVLLGAAPFAPVVPVFAKMARADLPLAAGMTALVPLLSAFVTPWVCALALATLPGSTRIPFEPLPIFLTLAATISLPLAAGVAVHHLQPELGRKLLRPVEILSEATGLVSLIVVTAAQFSSIAELGARPLLAMFLGSELSLVLGLLAGGRERGARRVIALGTSNRNIALALLIAVQASPGSSVLPMVVANGLLLILLGLVHVAYWRFLAPDADSAATVSHS